VVLFSSQFAALLIYCALSMLLLSGEIWPQCSGSTQTDWADRRVSLQLYEL